jgi:pimeloyl-ACP methyl ester carboxylesterase
MFHFARTTPKPAWRGAAAALAGALALAASTSAEAADPTPTIVLVHGAFADASTWSAVVSELAHDGYPVIAVANPLRSLSGDAAYVAAQVRAVKGPVVLVGHSYAGSVVSVAADGLPNVKALVFVDAFEPERGETALALTGRFPGSTLGPTLAAPVALPDGNQDLYVLPGRFPAQFAADLPEAEARVMAAEQRPVTQAALAEPASAAAWKTIPSWSIYGTADVNIPPATLVFMAKRANAREIVAVDGASHLVMMSHPDRVTALIEDAANSE